MVVSLWSTNPDLEALNKVKKEYRAIDVKLCLALMSMLKTAGDVAGVVRIEVEKLQRHRAKHDKILSGREVIAIIFESFRSSDNADVMFMIDNLINMKYPGDSKICDFYTQWHAILEGMQAEDVPPKRTLRDILYKKIRDSTVMKFDLSLYDQFADSDPMKTYDLLMSFIVKRIKLDREKKSQQEKEKAWTEITNPKPGAPATKAEKEKAKKEKEKKEKEKKEKEKKDKEKKEKEKEKKEKEKKEKERKEEEKKEKEKGDKPDKPSAPVIPDPKAKTHPHPGKGKGRGGRSNSPSGDKRPCYFYLVKRDCRNGKNCPFARDTKLREQAEKMGPPRSRSASPKGRGDRACRDFQKGNCSRGDKCPYSRKVDKPAAPAVKVAVTSATVPKQKKSVSFSTVINTKTFVIPVKSGTRWRTPKDPYQRHRNPKLCDPSFLESPDRIENINAQL